MLVDVHAHIDFPQFGSDRNNVIEEARKQGIVIINSGLAPEGIEKTISLTRRYDNVLATLGLSPQEFDKNILERTIDLIKKFRNDIVGIGEIGLDYYWVKDEEKRIKEIENFNKFIELSDELDLPLVIHSRNAESDVIEKLTEIDKRALLHCFGGTPEQAEDAISFGCLISIPTSIAYSKQKQKLAKKIPLENIVLETDAPYLAPKPKTRNIPINIKISVEKISSIKGIDKSIVEKTTTENARSFFKF
ncbi:MAG TPA: TatD family deoxyribonuclease [Candidatus Altiarchaeales archaeon]|nr:TatD family deoxyribonuclease [Candidatus Altiarchaeales archaeon]